MMADSVAAAPAQLKTGGEYGSRVLAFSPDGKTLAGTIYVPNQPQVTVGLWDLKTGKLKTTLETHPDVRALAFSPDSKTLATGKGGRWTGQIKLWDVKTGKLKRNVASGYSRRDSEGGRIGPYLGIGPVFALAFSPNGKSIAMGTQRDGELSSGGEALILNVATGKVTRTLKFPSHPVSSLAFSPNGRTVAVACQDGRIRLCSVRTGKMLRVTQKHSSLIPAVGFTPDGKSIVSVTDDQKVSFWSAQTGRLTRKLTRRLMNVGGLYKSAPEGFAISKDARTIAACGDEPVIRFASIK